MGMSVEETRWRMETGQYTAKWPGHDPRYKTPSVKSTIEPIMGGAVKPPVIMDRTPVKGGSWSAISGGGSLGQPQPMYSGLDTGSTMPVSDLKSRKWLILGFIAVIGFLAFGAMKK